MNEDMTIEEPILATEEILVAEEAPKHQPIVLCIDDEISILASLKRVLRKQPYDLLTASNGVEALELMETHQVDLIISDMRMPDMNGAQLLESVCQRWPHTVRILLTGYADIESTIAAINQGQIYRYLSKPWNNDDLISTISSALEFKQLKDEHRMLTQLTKTQNESLTHLNDSLEAKVKARTLEIAKAAKLLRQSFNQLKEGYENTINVFSHLIELREGGTSTHGHNVARLSEAIGKAMGLDENALSDLHHAAMLHDIGQLGFSDDLIATPYNSLNPDQLLTYQSHPKIGQAALLTIPLLDKVGKIIRSHHEHYNGGGFPDKLKTDLIPIESRILALASDFDDLKKGIFLGERLTSAQAASYIKQQSGSHYDPKIVDIFSTIYESISLEVGDIKQLKINHTDLKPGMILSENIVSVTGLLLLKEGQVLNQTLIGRIHLFVKDAGASNIVSISGTEANLADEEGAGEAV